MQFGLLRIVQDLIWNGDDANEESSTGMRPIHEAARAGYVEVIELLLTEGALCEVFDQKSPTPLLYAAKYGHESAVNLLMKSSKVYQAGISDEIFVVGVEHGHSNILKILLDTANRPPISALLASISHGHADATKVLLSAGAQPTGQALCTAVLAYDDDMVFYLLDYGANANESDSHGRTAMHYAVETDQFSTIKLLLMAGADLNCLDTQGQSPLFQAIKRKNISMVKHLLRQGADFRRVTKDVERTLMHVAALDDQPLIVKELLRFGADPSVEDCDSNRPLDLATSEDVVES